MAKLKIVYWRDIPGQVVVREGRRNTRLRLPARFMKAIERAAYRLKKHQKDALFEPWHDVEQPFNGDVREQADKLVQRLKEQYSDAVLDKLIRASGKDETRTLNP
ncbi:MAG: virulence factor [Gammaproteobacteria bacterium]